MSTLLLTLAALAAGSMNCPADASPAAPSGARLAELKTMQDVIGVALLTDGTSPPAGVILPTLLNRRQTLQFMLVHYPDPKFAKPGAGNPIAWVCIDKRGRVAKAALVNVSGNAALDSLSLRVLEVAAFAPARIGNDTVALWIPLPARVPPKEELNAALAFDEMDKSTTPVKTEYTKEPVLINRARVEAAIVRTIFNVNRDVAGRNERFNRAQDAGGNVLLLVYIDKTGTVTNSVVKRTSGNADLDQAAQQIATIMQFTPAQNKGTPVDVWIEVPISFRAR